jgi:hypothetical protein
MNIGIRFSSPIPEEVDLKLLSNLFKVNTNKIKEVLDNTPYEISILVCLIKRLDQIVSEVK